MTISRKFFISAVLMMYAAGSYAVDDNTVYLEALQRGIAAYKESAFMTSLNYFNAVLAEKDAKKFHGDALIWAAKVHMNVGTYPEAESCLEKFLLEFEKHSGYKEAYYLKGRLLYIQHEFQSSIEVLQGFLSVYGESEYSSLAYYWIGESLYELGHIKDSEKIFMHIVSRYPGKEKYDAASYKLSLIELKLKEQELLKLLKWSHEESLRALEEFSRREKTYEEAITAYQKRITALESSDIKKSVVELSETLASLQKQIGEKNQEIERLRIEIAALRLNKPASSPVSSQRDPAAKTSIDLDNKKELLFLKQEALSLKEAYMSESAIPEGAGK